MSKIPHFFRGRTRNSDWQAEECVDHSGFSEGRTVPTDFNWRDTVPQPPYHPGFHVRNMSANIRTDLYEEADCRVLEVELPGVKRDQIRLRVEEELMILEADLPARVIDYRRNYLNAERTTGHVSLPTSVADICIEDITARLQDGVLTIVMPKREPEPKRKYASVEIK